MLLHKSSTWPKAGGCSGIHRLFVVLAVLAMPAVARAEEPQVNVTEADGVYKVSATFTVKESAAAAMAVLADYDHLARFMPDLRKSAVVRRSGTRVLVDQEAVARLWAFSKEICLRLEIDESPLALRFHDIQGTSFSRYEGSWRISVEDGKTAIAYDLVAKPSFSVPEFVLKRLLKRDAGRMIEALQAEIAARKK